MFYAVSVDSYAQPSLNHNADMADTQQRRICSHFVLLVLPCLHMKFFYRFHSLMPHMCLLMPLSDEVMHFAKVATHRRRKMHVPTMQ